MSAHSNGPGTWVHTTLGAIREDLAEGVKPGSTPDEWFELYSVPSFPSGRPEVVQGRQIGSNKQTVVKDAVLVCKINPRINRIWVVGDETKHPKIASTEWITFWPVRGIESRYICYYLRQNSFRDFLAARASGVGGSLMRVKASTLHDFPLPLAPSREQRRIVAKIEELFSDLDAGVAALERVKASLTRYRAAVLQAAVEGRLTEAWRERNPSTEPATALLERILVERRAKWEAERVRRSAEAGKTQPKGWRDQYEDPPAPELESLHELPLGWTWMTADQLVDPLRVITYGVIKLGADALGGVSTLRTSDVKPLRLDLDDVKRISPEIASAYGRTFLQGGEVLIAVRGTLGGVAVAPTACRGFNISREVAMLALADLSMGSFVANAIASRSLQAWLLRRARGIAYTGINIETLRQLPIPIPPVAERAAIVAEVDRRLSVADATATQVEHALQRATRLRQAILMRAFEGRLVPQDPTDEPAEALLRRLRDGPVPPTLTNVATRISRPKRESRQRDGTR